MYQKIIHQDKNGTIYISGNSIYRQYIEWLPFVLSSGLIGYDAIIKTEYLFDINRKPFGINYKEKEKMKSTRKEVNVVLDRERAYQDAQRPDRFSEEVLPVSGELLIMKEYIDRAITSYVNNPGKAPLGTLHIIRKITATGVRTMEHHGALERLQ